MSTQRIAIEASADAIFAVLVDPYSYPEWLVGARRIRSVDDEWPEPDAAFHHVVGWGPIKVADSTRVVAVSAPVHLELDVRARPFGRARARFDLRPLTDAPAGAGTELSMTEVPTSPVLRGLGRILDPGIAVRNDASIKRLRALVLSRFPAR